MKKFLTALMVLAVAGQAWAVTNARSLEFSTLGKKRVVTGIIGFDDSYATGGEVVTAEMIGLSNVDMMMFASDPYGCTFNYVTDSYGADDLDGHVQVHNFGTTYDDGSTDPDGSVVHSSEHPSFNIVVDSYGEIRDGSNLANWLTNVKFMAIGN